MRHLPNRCLPSFSPSASERPAVVDRTLLKYLAAVVQR